MRVTENKKLVFSLQGHVAEGKKTGTLMFGRHGDINPANILWFGNPERVTEDLHGTLQLADFGQAELNSRMSRTKVIDVPNTLTYRPPESDMKPTVIRQSYDIWCLGCVFLEFVAWILEGNSALAKFALERSSPDATLNMQRTDTFFEAWTDSEVPEPIFRVKSSVIKV
jgi:serine/threonine protein kinase